jgi:TonB-linked SusC/RagA family outer membrane protein
MRSKFKWIFTLLLALSMQFSFAQEKTVTGVVSDKTGPLPGANVVVKGTTRGTQTDFDGKFSIQAKQGEVLVISFVGMQDTTVTVGAANTINVQMQDGVQLSEVVIQTNLGYFKKDANKITSGISVVSSDELARQSPSQSVENALQGKAAGIQVSALNGQPGQRAYVSIRGAVNITGGNANAQYVVDGAFVRASEIPALSPSDIESVTVLKDGAAAALYGIKGGNGVVVITTKKGRSTKAKFEVTNSIGYSEKIPDAFKVMNADQKIAYENALQDGPSFGLTDPELAILRSFDHKWSDDLLRQGTLHNFNFSMSSGNEKMSNYLSVGYNKNTGIVKNIDGYDRITARYNTDFEATTWLKGSMNIGGAYEKTQTTRDRNNIQNPFRANYDLNPYEPVFDRDLTTGELIIDPTTNQPTYNPTSAGLSIAEAILHNTAFIRSFRGYVRPSLDVTLYKGLVVGTRFNMNYERRQTESYTQPGSQLDLILNNGVATGTKNDAGSDNLEYQWTNTLSYKFDLGESHHFNAILLEEYNRQNFRSHQAVRDGFADPAIGVGPGATPTLATTAWIEIASISYFANVDYDYKGKYLLSLYGRRDGSSMAGSEVKWRNAKGISAGWNVTKEDFFKVKNIDLLKLRMSYGQLNTLNNIDAYTAIATYDFDGHSYAGLVGSGVSEIGNPVLSFEQAKKLDLGVDLQMFKGRIAVTGSYFYDKRNDFIYDGQTTNATGYPFKSNVGDWHVKGGEIELKAFAVRNKNTSLSFYVNAAKFDRMVDHLDNPNDPTNTLNRGLTQQQVGYAPDTFFMINYAGIDPTNGHPLYYKNDGTTTDNILGEGVEEHLSAGKTPYAKYEGGFGTEFNWKGFDISADFVFKSGNWAFNQRELNSYSDGGNIASNQAVGAANYWTPTNTTSSIPVPNQILALNGETDVDGNSIDSNQTSTRFLHDASFIRFRTLSFGYTFDKTVLKNLPLDKVRLFCQMQNLHTWTKFLGDPEVGIGNNEASSGASTTNTLVVGQFQGYSYPTTKTVVFGLTVNF